LKKTIKDLQAELAIIDRTLQEVFSTPMDAQAMQIKRERLRSDLILRNKKHKIDTGRDMTSTPPLKKIRIKLQSSFKPPGGSFS